MLFDYPKGAFVGRVLTKTRINAHIGPHKAIKDHLARQVEQVVWQYRLAPETIGLEATPAVPEIQVYHLALKTGKLSADVLSCLDQMFPVPIFFKLRFEGRIQVVAAYKRPAGADGSPPVSSAYFESPWVPSDAQRAAWPEASNLEILYERLLEPLLPFPARKGESLQARVERMEQIRALQREVMKCKGRLRTEENAVRKAGIAVELQKLKEEIDRLAGA